MQQQQMEDDQRWLEQEESFMVDYTHFLVSLLKAGGKLHKIWQLKSNIYMCFGYYWLKYLIQTPAKSTTLPFPVCAFKYRHGHQEGVNPA